MTGPPAPAPEETNQTLLSRGSDIAESVHKGFWARLHKHKVAEWTLAYAAAAYTALHLTEMVSEALDWPHLVARTLTLLLALGFPIVITLAWYQGAKSLKRVTGPELAIITVLLVIAGSVLWTLSRSNRGHATADAGVTANTAPGPADGRTVPTAPRTSIAVMPFANLTGDPSKDYLGDGMAEEVINTLTKVPGLQVPSRTSSFAYKGRNTDIRQIARDLNVGSVLEGSVRTAGNRIRITAQLIDARNGLHLWAQTYNEMFTDLFQLQDELATAIVEQLQGKLSGSAGPSFVHAPPTRDVEAYDLYLRGFPLMLSGSEQNLRLALDLFQKALTRDPTFARALAARSRARLTFLVRGYPLANALEDAEQDARQALALDPGLGVANQALGNVSALRADWLQAEASYRAGLAADTGEPDLHSGYAMVVLAATGRIHQAYSEAQKAYLLAPASATYSGIFALLSAYRGLDADSARLADLTVARGRNSGAMAQIYALAAARQGRFSEAATRVADALPPAIRDAGGSEAIRLMYAALGDPAKRPAARQALTTLVAKVGRNQLTPATQRDLITRFSMLGALDFAYDLAKPYLDEFIRSGSGGGADWVFLWLPEMRPFRQDSRFQAYVTRMNLIPYWLQYGPPDECDVVGGTLRCH